jgi:GR25 family glycosyltransferase involved in LPS biosynthesis
MNNVIRFKGIDGLSYTFTEDEENMFKNSDFIMSDAKPKIMGNQLSHYYILKDMIKNNYNYIIIFQDDVILREDFNIQINQLLKNIPNDAEIINFGFHKTAHLKDFEALNLNDPIESQVKSKKNINDVVCILADNVNPCSLAYLVTLEGAKNLVNYFNTVGFLRATDWNYTDYLISKNINYATRTILCTGNASFESDIFK